MQHHMEKLIPLYSTSKIHLLNTTVESRQHSISLIESDLGFLITTDGNKRDVPLPNANPLTHWYYSALFSVDLEKRMSNIEIACVSWTSLLIYVHSAYLGGLGRISIKGGMTAEKLIALRK